jgi:hypothetical protein
MTRHSPPQPQRTPPLHPPSHEPRVHFITQLFSDYQEPSRWAKKRGGPGVPLSTPRSIRTTLGALPLKDPPPKPRDCRSLCGLDLADRLGSRGITQMQTWQPTTRTTPLTSRTGLGPSKHGVTHALGPYRACLGCLWRIVKEAGLSCVVPSHWLSLNTRTGQTNGKW